jgi:hypothetical protein
MKLRLVPALAASLLFFLGAILAFATDQTTKVQTPADQKAPDQKAADQKPDKKVISSAHLGKENRMDIIRTFTADLVFAHTTFPMGKEGLVLKDGVVTPDHDNLQQMITMWGAALKPGDRAIISAVFVKPDRIRFEVNGGPVRKKKWYQHIEVSGSGGDVPLGAPDAESNIHGSFVDLVFSSYVPDLTPSQVKDLLRPALDFEAKSALDAYLETVPPKVKDAIQHHSVLVGMNHDMVLFAKGRAPKKDREKDGETDYEEWIYGDPPQEVDFVRFVGDEVVRVETISVTGEKVIRTQKEVDVTPTVAKEQKPEARPANAPSLRRPGEVPDAVGPDSGTPGPAAPIPTGPPIDNGKGAPPDPGASGPNQP